MDNNNMAALGQYIRKIREEKNISAYGIEKDLGFSRTVWSRIENGRQDSSLKPDTLQQIAKILEIDVTELYLVAGYLTQENIDYIKSKK